MKSYLSEIGRKGGQRSRRKLSSQEALGMVKVREAKRAFKRFYANCFWSYDRNMRITRDDVTWVAEQLMRHGNREAWYVGNALCR